MSSKPHVAISCKASMHIGKKWSAAHNRRDYDKAKWNLDGHIQSDRTSLNVTLCDADFKTWFHQQFDAAIDDFNEKNKGKHNDRLIDKEKFFHDNSGKAQECIIQLGDHAAYTEMVDTIGQTAADETHIRFLTDAYKQWKEKNPAFRVFSAIIHMDESTPHLHLDFVPVAESKRGLSVKISMDGALKNNGFERKKDHKFAETPYKLWLAAQRERTEALAGQYIDLIPSEHETGKKHVETWQYRSEQARNDCAELKSEHKRVSDEVNQLQEEQQKLNEELSVLREAKVTADEVKGTAKPTIFGNKVTIKKDEFELLQQQAAAYRVNKTDMENLAKARKEFEKQKVEELKQLAKRESTLEATMKILKHDAYLQVKQDLETYEKQANTNALSALKKRVEVEQEYEKLREQRAAAEERERQAQEAYRNNLDACKLRDEAERKAKRLQEEVDELNLKIKVIEDLKRQDSISAQDIMVQLLDDKQAIIDKQEQQIKTERKARDNEHTAYEKRVQELLEQHRKEIDELKEKHNAEISNLKSELEKFKIVFKKAATFIKESCQAIGMLIDRKGNEYHIPKISDEQSSLIEVVRDGGSKLLGNWGLKKMSDEIKYNVSLAQDIEERIEEKIEEKQERTQSYGGMTR